ncbi:hypothetical protein ACFYUR_20845 [Micromonospora haikouensis]|uniref:hypothetical protein n=1 Tax=Micromonospora haikouensis TaxID=686309 RepID=UPI0036C89A16
MTGINAEADNTPINAGGDSARSRAALVVTVCATAARILARRSSPDSRGTGTVEPWVSTCSPYKAEATDLRAIVARPVENQR